MYVSDTVVHARDIVPVEIEVWPSVTLFEAGSTLQLTIQGRDAARYPAFGHRKLVNRGEHAIFTGGAYDSSITLPLNDHGVSRTTSGWAQSGSYLETGW